MLNGILKPRYTIERTHLSSVNSSHFSTIVLPLECPDAEVQAVERVGLHNLVEEEAGLEEGNCRMLPVLLKFSLFVLEDVI